MIEEQALDEQIQIKAIRVVPQAIDTTKEWIGVRADVAAEEKQDK